MRSSTLPTAAYRLCKGVSGEEGEGGLVGAHWVNCPPRLCPAITISWRLGWAASNHCTTWSITSYEDTERDFGSMLSSPAVYAAATGERVVEYYGIVVRGGQHTFPPQRIALDLRQGCQPGTAQTIAIHTLSSRSNQTGTKIAAVSRCTALLVPETSKACLPHIGLMPFTLEYEVRSDTGYGSKS